MAWSAAKYWFTCGIRDITSLWITHSKINKYSSFFPPASYFVVNTNFCKSVKSMFYFWDQIFQCLFVHVADIKDTLRLYHADLLIMYMLIYVYILWNVFSEKLTWIYVFRCDLRGKRHILEWIVLGPLFYELDITESVFLSVCYVYDHQHLKWVIWPGVCCDKCSSF